MFKKRLSPALALFLIAPAFGELFSGSAPLNEYINPIIFVILSLLYGCGAIIIRELVIRWNKGWPSLLLLGFAYGIYEEGLVVRSFFDPNWMDLGKLGVYGRLAGVNWVWAEHLTIYHALISIAASIVFVEMLYPERRSESWVASKKWLFANWAGFLVVLGLGQLMTSYDAPDGWILLSWLSIFALTGLARIIPARVLAPRERQAPRPRRFFLTGLIGVLAQFILIYNGADNGAYPFPVAMLLLVLFDLFVLWLVLRWNGNGVAWDDRHRMALVNVAMSFFLIFGPLTSGGRSPVMFFSNPVFLFLLWLAYKKVKKRTESEAVASVTV
ncbi:MAG: hypothetical protein GXP32_09405 [Kiritimatiellaeota bacterium]|nr:hypothetical protein [Kiritimatiellota bacterium]